VDAPGPTCAIAPSQLWRARNLPMVRSHGPGEHTMGLVTPLVGRSDEICPPRGVATGVPNWRLATARGYATGGDYLTNIPFSLPANPPESPAFFHAAERGSSEGKAPCPDSDRAATWHPFSIAMGKFHDDPRDSDNSVGIPPISAPLRGTRSDTSQFSATFWRGYPPFRPTPFRLRLCPRTPPERHQPMNQSTSGGPFRGRP
jgi:hypothetical protein